MSAGPYSVTVSDNNNCLWNENFLIETKPFDTTSVKVKNVKCKGDFTGEIDIIGINGGVAPYTFLWSNDSNYEQIRNSNGWKRFQSNHSIHSRCK